MISYKLNSVILERTMDLERTKSKYEDRLKVTEYVKHDSPIIKAIEVNNVKYKINETQRLIDINTEIYKANGGTFQ